MDAQILKAVAQAAARIDDNCSPLRVVRIHEGVAVATDGKMLIQASLSGEDRGKDGKPPRHIPAEDLRKITQKETTVEQIGDGSYVVRGRGGTSRSVPTAPAPRWPNVDRITAKAGKTKRKEVTLTLPMLERLVAAMKAVARADGRKPDADDEQCAVKLHVTNERHPVMGIVRIGSAEVISVWMAPSVWG
jgi:hypothetical protein